MRKTMLVSLSLFLICVIHMPASAGDFDGSKELLCACMRVIECGPDGNCAEVSAEEIGIPEFLKINFKQKTIGAPQLGKNQRAEDGYKEVRDGAGWSMAISEETGKMVLTESGDQVGFVIFGACISR